MDSYLAKILSLHPERAAPALLGCRLIRHFDGQKAIVKIVETESYHESDAASHSHKGQTKRSKTMFGPAGYLYVYFTYGMHYCCNIVTGPAGEGSAVLIRAVEPIAGTELLERNRVTKSAVDLTNGPAKLCQALNIDLALNGHDLSQPPISLEPARPLPASKIVTTKRIGITKEADKLWRFYIKDNPFVSRTK